MFVVSETQLKYHRPARLDDELLVTAELRQIGSASLIIGQRVLSKTEQERTGASAPVLLCEGTIRIGWVDAASIAARTHSAASDGNPRALQRLHVTTFQAMNQDLSIISLLLHASFVGAAGRAAAGRSSPSPAGPRSSARTSRSSACAPLNDDFDREFWSGTSLNELFSVGRAERQVRRPHGAHLRLAACANTKSCASATSPTPAPCSTARAAPCAPATSASSTRSSRTCPSWPPSVRCRRTSACSARSGASCTPSPAWPPLAQVTLATVAPGIAEALVATAIGLFAAIPAVVAYNRFSREIDKHRHPAGDLHRRVLQHPAAQPGRPIVTRRRPPPASR